MHTKNSWHLFIPKSYLLLKTGYTVHKFKNDFIAGLTVAIVALPLSMALAIASGTTPDKGLITAIIAGFFISLFGGSRHQIGGPTGAFVVVVFNVIHDFSYEGLIIATAMAGVLLIFAGLLRLGTYIKYIPHPVVTGFTSGIAMIIFVSQINDFLGLKLTDVPADFIEKLQLIFSNIKNYDTWVLLTAVLTLGLILLLRKTAPKTPAFLLSIIFMSLLIWGFAIPVETIGSKFGGITPTIPTPSFPPVTLDTIKQLLPSAFTIAFLAGIESLLSAVVADGMTGNKHRSNCELVAQGIANIASALFTGLPATGAIARTATNIRSGAYSPLAGMIHALILLAFVLILGPLCAYIPLACLSAILMVVAWNMSEFDKFIHLFKAPVGDRFVLLVTFLLTILVDLNLAIEVGFVLSTVLFTHRMANAVYVQTHQNVIQDDLDDLESEDTYLKAPALPQGIISYQFSGPFFFGAAERLIETLNRTGAIPNVIILQMRDVPFIDSTGSTALSTFINHSMKSGVWLIFSCCNSTVHLTLEKMNKASAKPNIQFCKTFDQAVDIAKEINQKRLQQHFES